MAMKFSKGNQGNIVSYPLTQSQFDNLDGSAFASPKVGKTNGLGLVVTDDNIDALTAEVEAVRADVVNDVFPQTFLDTYYPFEGSAPTEIPQPLLNEGLTKGDVGGLANIVHMDLPMDLPHAILKWLVADGAVLKQNDDDYNMFTETILDVIEDIADGVKEYGNKAFETKWFYGVARPEEISSQGAAMTHYPEGCPTHPSYPAGHGAIAGGSVLAFFNHFDLTPAQTKTILDSVYLWSMFRTFAGVHYGDDNVAGIFLSLSDKFTPAAQAKYSEVV